MLVSCGVSVNHDYVVLLGTHQGEILVFSVSPKGSNINLKETIPGIYIYKDLSANPQRQISII